MPFLNDNMHSQEELAALLDRNLTLNPIPVPAPAPVQETQEPKITYSISQHYHHSAHIAKSQQQQQQAQHDGASLDVGHHPVQRPASEPPQPEYQAAGTILASHGVDPSVLSQAQLELFKTVDEPQKLYLVQLWRFSPPTNSNDNPTLAWSSTTVEQEEALVRLRLQADQMGDSGASAMSLDGTPVPTPIQGGDGRWLYATSYMEPYMAAGYESAEQQQQQQQQQQQRQATDPVYRTTNAGILPDWASKQETMENNYGMLMAMRENMEL